jgi:hypothetical protein
LSSTPIKIAIANCQELFDLFELRIFGGRRIATIQIRKPNPNGEAGLGAVA